MINRWLTLLFSIGLAGCGSVVVQGTPDDGGVETDAPPTDRPGLDVTSDRPASSNDVGRACTTPADCAGDQACVGAEGCGTPWTCQSVEGRVCNGDWSPMCGCDGQTFYGTRSCPDRPFARRGLCTMPPAPVDAGAAPSCPPQEARGDGLCDGFFGYAWSGSACVGVTGCRCMGADCGALPRDRMVCERNHRGCPRPI